MSDEGFSRPGLSDRRSTIRLIATGVVGAGMSSVRASAAPARPRHPVPPCGAAEIPACSHPDAPPAFAIWQDSDLGDWRPPPCLGWSGPTRSAQAIAATFRFGGSDADLLAHIGNLALHSTIRYWSKTQGGWRRLITSAEVVADVGGRPTANAFAAADFAVGTLNYYAETTAHAGRAVYRLRTLFRSAERIVLATDNASPIRAWGLQLFDPGALQSVTFLERRGAGVWTYYAIARAGAGASRFASGRGESYVNRLVALFRFTAGIPTDAEPPVAR